MTGWKKFDHKDKATWPIEVGVYAVMVKGDSEYLDGHCIYSFDDYQTFADCEVNEEGYILKGYHDEEAEFMFAYYGPIIIPKFVEIE